MKLIIEIPDGYDYLSDIKNGSIASANILNAVKNGKPLEGQEPVYWEVVEHGKTRLDTFVRCPKCGTVRQGITYYCSWCGQKMVWNGMPSCGVERGGEE